MKKLLLLLLSLSLTTISLTSCNFFGSGTESVSDSSVSTPAPDVEEKTYTVTFKQSGQEDVVIEVKEGGSLTKAQIPTPKDKTGYKVEWKETSLTNIQGNIVVEAKETPITYKITYDLAGGELNRTTQDVLYDNNVVLATPTRDGYTFTGWVDADGNGVTSGKWKHAGNITLKATWVPAVVTKYTVLFTQEGEKPQSFEVEEGTAFTAIPNYVAKTGYEVKWNEDKLALLSNVTANITVEAIEIPNTYTLTYDAGEEGTASKPSQTVTFDAAVGEMATATRSGYIFKGWFNGQTEVTAKTIWKVADNVTLTAKWEAESIPDPEYVIVTFKNGLTDTVIKTCEVEKGTALESGSVPALPSVEGYTFAWDKDTTATFTEDTTITAVETAKTYTLTYNAGEEGTASKPSQTVTYNSAIGEMATATRDGYEFAGWLYNGTTVTASTVWTFATDAELTANWTKITKYYTVTFTQKAQQPKTFEVEEGTAFTNIPDYVAKTGYEVKWNEDKLAMLNNVTENITVDAIETAIKYKVTYQDNKGQITGQVTLEYDATYDLTPTAVVTGYTFDKFTNNGVTVATKGTWTIASDVTLVVNWKANTYTVTLDANGGSCSSTSMKITYDSEYTLPTPTRSGYTFTGWYTENGNKVEGNTWKLTGANNSIKLKAAWKANDDSSEGEWTKNY